MSALGERRLVDTARGTVACWDRGEGPPVVLLHGLGVNAAHWRKVVPLLAERFRCVVPELPLGSHDVPMPRGADLSLDGLADLVDDLLAALGLDHVALVGNDTGGAIAQAVVARHPDRVGRLVLTPCDAFDNFLPRRFRFLQVLAWIPGAALLMAHSLRSRAIRRLPLAGYSILANGIPDDVMDSYVRPMRASRGARRDISAMLRRIRKRYTRQAAARLPEFRRPALIAWAREDRVFPFAHAERLAELLPDARLVAIEGSRSFVPEDRPDALAEEVARFLAETGFGARREVVR